jgi:hypothetical protein
MYLVHPSWALPIPVMARGLLFIGLIILFFLLSHIMCRLFEPLALDKPPIIFPKGFSKYIKDNAWLFVICFLAVLLHIIPISSPVYLVGDEALFLQNGLWIYDYFGAFWHKVMQYIFWIAIILTLVMVKIKSAGNSDGWLSNSKARRVAPLLFLFSGSCLVIYFILTRDLPYNIFIIREPPLQKFLYQISYFVLGINYIGPRLWQLLFYILSAFYLYRTITLFSDRETALLGASIYLFSPIIFDYAHFAELASGLIFFIILISYYFLRFLIYQDNRDLLLSAYFIGTGFLYKRDIFLMFFICSAYLVFQKLKSREFPLIRPLKILSLALFPIMPWLIIGKFFNWRNAWISLSQFTSFNKVTAYFLSIPAQLSWIIFSLFVLSFFYILLSKRSHLSFYWGALFIAFYLFYTSQHIPTDAVAHRFSMAFYPTIAVFIALFFTHIVHKIRWRYAFKLGFSVITIYLIFLCTVPSFSERLITYRDVKAQYFPGEQAMQWVRDNIKDGDKILSFRFKADMYYRDKYGIDKDKIISFWYGVDDIGHHLTPQELTAYCNENNISHIMFPYGSNFSDNPENTALRNYVNENKNNEFIEAVKFNLKDNYIGIYKLIK